MNENTVIVKVNVSDLRTGLDLGEYGEYLSDYRDSDSYICDVISEIADNHTSIYYSQIMDFIRENPYSLGEVIDEGLYDPRHNYDIFQHGQAAEYMTIERSLYDHLADSLMMAAIDFIIYDLKRETIPEELADLLPIWCKTSYSSDLMDEIPDRIRDFLGEE